MITRITLLLCCLFPFLAHTQLQCDNDTTGLISLIDLGPDMYLGMYQGGLYPGGSNIIPTGHKNAGKKISKAIKPLDTLGNVDWLEGEVVMAVFGASTAAQPFKQFQNKVDSATGLNGCLKTIVATNGGNGIEEMTRANLDYWNEVRDNQLTPKGVTPEMIQVAWLFHGSQVDTIYDMPLQADSLYTRFKETAMALAEQYPNLQLLYISAPYYGGYADPLHAHYEAGREPVPYHTNFAIKWLVGDQIAKDPDLKYKEPGKKVPFMMWGPHVWADGMRANETDGLTWACEEFRVDGGGWHLNNSGKEKVGQMLFDFFNADEVASYWYKDAARWADCSTGRYAEFEDYYADDTSVEIIPSPNSGAFKLYCHAAANASYSLQIFDMTGREVFAQTGVQSHDPEISVAADLAPGIYAVRLLYDGKTGSELFVVH